MEEWRIVEGFPMYEVSSFGSVRSVKRIDALNRSKGRTLKQHLRGPSRYLGVNLYDCQLRPFGKLVHQLVLEAFVGPKPSSEHESAHLDGDKFNNRATNLAWKTHQQNIDDKKLHGTALIGEKNPAATITADTVLAIREDFARGMRKTHIARQRNISRSMVYNIVTGRNWKHLP